MNNFSESDIGVLDRIIETRRSVRSFKGEVPSDSMIKAIIHAGVCAPDAAIAIGDTMDFRRFIVFRKGSEDLSLMKSNYQSSSQSKSGSSRKGNAGQVCSPGEKQRSTRKCWTPFLKSVFRR